MDSNDKTNIPDIVREYEVDWSRYTPTGGHEFQEQWESNVRGIVERYGARAEEYRVKTIEKLGHVFAVNAALDAAKSDVSTASECLNLLGTPDAERLVSEVRAGVDALRACLTGFDQDEMRASIEDAKRESAFANSFIEMVQKDDELDRILYAMSEVPMKFRAKLLRHLAREMSVIDGLISSVKANIGSVPDAVREPLQTILGEIDYAWTITFITVRAMKRAADKSGIEAAFGDDMSAYMNADDKRAIKKAEARFPAKFAAMRMRAERKHVA